MDTDARKQYKNAAHLVNDKLKKIGRQLGLAIPLTSYVARHAWASIAKSKNIPISTISEAMGHDSENTTPCLIRHIGRGQGQQPYSKITVIGRKICIIPAHRTDSKKAIRKMAIETEKLCNLKHLFLREVFCKCKDTQKSNKRFTINEIYCPSE